MKHEEKKVEKKYLIEEEAKGGIKYKFFKSKIVEN